MNAQKFAGLAVTSVQIVDLPGSLLDATFKSLDEPARIAEQFQFQELVYRRTARQEQARTRSLLPDYAIINESLLADLARNLLQKDRADLLDNEALLGQQPVPPNGKHY